MDPKAPYLCWKGVASDKAYAVYRWDDALGKNPSGPALSLASDEPLAARWPAKVMCLVKSSHAYKKPVLPDYLMNTGEWLVISGRLRAFLENADVRDIEYLPVHVIDPTGLPLDTSYSIAHTLNSPDCLDMTRSGAKPGRLIPAKAEKIQRIVLKNDPARSLFRPATFSKVTLLSWALAEAMAEHGFTGFRFMGLFDYGITGDLSANPERAPVDALCSRLWKNAKVS